jgi:hypothetical protein
MASKALQKKCEGGVEYFIKYLDGKDGLMKLL